MNLLQKLAAFEKAHPVRSGPQCGACRLPEAIREFLVAGRKKGSTFTSLAAVVRGEGHKVSAYTVGRHLRGDCAQG